ncbi:MAG: phospholipase D-like domain-containing protein [Candidatus Omnitrophica bacterium]|nr:phospholipase D-like domain-containing protein [Candidatus Omnitrophota bacterium]
MKLNKLRIALLLIILALCIPAFAVAQGSEFHPAKVRDISDRAYEGAVIQLLDSAKESIVMSMYLIKADGSGPVYLLVKDLEEALDRGVRVEIYLNTHPMPDIPPVDLTAQPLKTIIDKGAKVYKFTPSVRMHDKLIIVDSRYVVDGSVNWSVSAIKSNYESAVLIDSPELAKDKLTRLRNFPLEGQVKKEDRLDRPEAFTPLPAGAVVEIPSELMNNRSYLPAMHVSSADQDITTYLLLLAESARTGKREFFVPLEELSAILGVRPKWTTTEMRQQAMGELRTLESRYKLIDVRFSHSKDAWVKMRELPGAAFKVSGGFFEAKSLAGMSLSAKFVYLMRALLESEGKSIDSIRLSDLSRRFGVSRSSIRAGLREIRGGDSGAVPEEDTPGSQGVPA